MKQFDSILVITQIRQKKFSFTLDYKGFNSLPTIKFSKKVPLGAIHKGYPIFLAHIGPTYLYPIFGPIFGHIYLSISIHIRFLKTYLLTRKSDILYGRPLIEQNIKVVAIE